MRGSVPRLACRIPPPTGPQTSDFTHWKRVGRPWVVMCTSCPLPPAVVMRSRDVSCSFCRASRITKSRSETPLMEFWMILLHDYQKQDALIPRIYLKCQFNHAFDICRYDIHDMYIAYHNIVYLMISVYWMT